jgi:hypothetical protein
LNIVAALAMSGKASMTEAALGQRSGSRPGCRLASRRGRLRIRRIGQVESGENLAEQSLIIRFESVDSLA